MGNMNSLKFPSLPILLVDDEKQFLYSCGITLSSNEINNIVECNNSQNVMKILNEQNFQVILLDLNMPGLTGKELLPLIVKDFSDTPVIILTAIDEVDMAVDCMKVGAFDFLVKPVKEQLLITRVKRAIEQRETQSEIALLKHHLLTDKLYHAQAFSNIITKSSIMRSIFKYIEAISATTLPILITGETGVGKELIANSIHEVSGRKGKFIPVNIAGLDDALFSDTLFGHQKGAFTSAENDRKGLIEQASNGTFFLDEIGDLRIESQVKILRLLQDGKYYPVGSDISKFTNARIIVATNREIETLVEKEQFRKDLYYRLKAHHIHIPPLRERKEDILLLLEHFLQKAAKKLNKKKPSFSDGLITLLNTYNFPGNVRELEGMVFDAVGQYQSYKLPLEAFKTKIGKMGKPIHDKKEEGIILKNDKHLITFSDQLPTLKEAEEVLIYEALKRSNSNKTLAAHLLGITKQSLNYHLKKNK